MKSSSPTNNFSLKKIKNYAQFFFFSFFSFLNLSTPIFTTTQYTFSNYLPLAFQFFPLSESSSVWVFLQKLFLFLYSSLPYSAIFIPSSPHLMATESLNYVRYWLRKFEDMLKFLCYYLASISITTYFVIVLIKPNQNKTQEMEQILLIEMKAWY